MNPVIAPRHLNEPGLAVLDLTAADEEPALALMDGLQHPWAISGITPIRREPGLPGIPARVHADIRTRAPRDPLSQSGRVTPGGGAELPSRARRSPRRESAQGRRFHAGGRPAAGAAVQRSSARTGRPGAVLLAVERSDAAGSHRGPAGPRETTRQSPTRAPIPSPTDHIPPLSRQTFKSGSSPAWFADTSAGAPGWAITSRSMEQGPRLCRDPVSGPSRRSHLQLKRYGWDSSRDRS